MKRSLIACIALMLALVALAPEALAVQRGAGGDHTTGASRARVRIVDNAFQPGRITIARGTRVRWVNQGSRTHTTTSNTGAWDRTLPAGESFTRRFGQRGRFRYHCTIHSSMTGTIRVT